MSAENAYLKLNTECYGGPILNTWLDIPLGISGRVVVKGDSVLRLVEKIVNILERICLSLGKDREEFFNDLYSSFMISADLAHAVHPNISEKHGPINIPIMGGGLVIKINANQSDTSDAYSISIYKNICKESTRIC